MEINVQSHEKNVIMWNSKQNSVSCFKSVLEKTLAKPEFIIKTELITFKVENLYKIQHRSWKAPSQMKGKQNAGCMATIYLNVAWLTGSGVRPSHISSALLSSAILTKRDNWFTESTFQMLKLSTHFVKKGICSDRKKMYHVTLRVKLQCNHLQLHYQFSKLQCS